MRNNNIFIIIIVITIIINSVAPLLVSPYHPNVKWTSPKGVIMAQERGLDLLTFWGCFENQHGWGPGAKFRTYFVCFNFHFQLSSCFIDRKFNPGFCGVSHPCPPCKIPKFKLCLSFGILHSARMFEGLRCWSAGPLQSLRLFSVSQSHLQICQSTHLPIQATISLSVLTHWKVQCLESRLRTYSTFRINSCSESSKLLPSLRTVQGKLYYLWSSSFTLLSRHVIYTMESSPALGLLDLFTSVTKLSQDSTYRGCPWLCKMKENWYKGRETKSEMF